MNAIASLNDMTSQTPLVEVLTFDGSPTILGYRLGGFHPGPHVMVAGHAPVANLVYDQLMKLPTLGWMRGTLTLVFLHEMERFGFSGNIETAVTQKLDEVLFLPYDLVDAHHAQAAKEGYWSVLRLCTRLGLITGRGIPAAPSLQSEEDDDA